MWKRRVARKTSGPNCWRRLRRHARQGYLLPSSTGCLGTRALFWPCAIRGCNSPAATCPTPIPLPWVCLASSLSMSARPALSVPRMRSKPRRRAAPRAARRPTYPRMRGNWGGTLGSAVAREHGGIRQATALILVRQAQGLSCERIAGKLNPRWLYGAPGRAFLPTAGPAPA
jgi:hypothetical protein